VSASRRWEIVEHTADVGIRGWGENFPTVVEALARGLFEVIAGPGEVESQVVHKLRIEGVEREDLLHEALEALNTLHQVRGEIYGEVRVEALDTGLAIEVEGEAIDPDRHDLRTEVKAVTWHDLRVEETADGWEGYVLLDI
jgi:SHS2 domain-containing protein